MVVIEQYLKLKVGEVWAEIEAELKMEGLEMVEVGQAVVVSVWKSF